MSRFWGVFSYEYRMSIRRWGVWLAFLLAVVPAFSYISSTGAEIMATQFTRTIIWQSAGTVAFWMNLFTPIVAGIAMADRSARDGRLGVRELLRSTPLSRPAYILGKYLAAVAAALTPVFVFSMACYGYLITQGFPAVVLPAALAAFATVNVPAYLFIMAFSLACPEVLPLRVYQVLFTGYWFWGNFLNPKVLPTLNGTYFTPSGDFALNAFFGGFQNATLGNSELPYSVTHVFLNWGTLALCAAAALFVLGRYLNWQEQRA
jgi:ABC-2 type transport system permease protein